MKMFVLLRLETANVVNSINCFKVYHRLAVPDKYRRVSPVCSGVILPKDFEFN